MPLPSLRPSPRHALPTSIRCRSILAIGLLLALAVAALPAAAQDNPSQSSDSGVVPSAPPTVLATGWRTYQQVDDNYAVTLPPTWRRIDLDPATVAASVKAVTAEDPTIADWLGQQAATLVASDVSFFAFDFSPGSQSSGFATNVNVIHTPLPGPIPLTTVVELSAAQLENTSSIVGAVDHQPVTLAAGPAERFNYHLQLAGRSLSVRQFLVVHGSDSYVLTLTTTDDQADSYSDTFDQIGQSFQLLS